MTALFTGEPGPLPEVRTDAGTVTVTAFDADEVRFLEFGRLVDDWREGAPSRPVRLHPIPDRSAEDRSD